MYVDNSTETHQNFCYSEPMKVCSRCKSPKPLADFAKRSQSKDGLSYWCRQCFSEYEAERYAAEPAERDRKSANKKQRKLRNQIKLKEILQSSACMDCGTTDWRVLEFDHRDPELKSFNISGVPYTSWEALEAEISKCDIVCANCHRIRTAEYFGTWRSR